MPWEYSSSPDKRQGSYTVDWGHSCHCEARVFVRRRWWQGGDDSGGHLDSPRAHASTFFRLGQPASINSSGRKMMGRHGHVPGVLVRFRCSCSWLLWSMLDVQALSPLRTSKRAPLRGFAAHCALLRGTPSGPVRPRTEKGTSSEWENIRAPGRSPS